MTRQENMSRLSAALVRLDWEPTENQIDWLR